MTDIGAPDPLEPVIDVIPEHEPLPGPVELPEPAPAHGLEPEAA